MYNANKIISSLGNVKTKIGIIDNESGGFLENRKSKFYKIIINIKD